MKKSLILIATALLALSLVACSQPAAPSTSSAPPASTSAETSATSQMSTATAPGVPSSAAVWQNTISSNAYKSWPTAPGYSTMMPAKGPHGKFVQIYVDPTMQAALSGSAATAWPVGGMIVKDAYDANKQLISIEYMQKTDTGWYFASYSPDGTVSKEGVKVEPCESCHAKNSSDGVKSFKLPQ